MQGQNLLLARRYTERADRAHNGRIVTMRSNLRPLPADLRCKSPAGQRVRRWLRPSRDTAMRYPSGQWFTCWNGEIVRGAFIIDAHDREIIAWCAVVNAGIAGSDLCDMMLTAVEARFCGHRAPHQIEILTPSHRYCVSTAGQWITAHPTLLKTRVSSPASSA